MSVIRRTVRRSRTESITPAGSRPSRSPRLSLRRFRLRLVRPVPFPPLFESRHRHRRPRRPVFYPRHPRGVSIEGLAASHRRERTSHAKVNGRGRATVTFPCAYNRIQRPYMALHCQKHVTRPSCATIPAAGVTGWHRLAQAGTGWHRLAHRLARLARLAQAGTGWHRLAQAGTGWHPAEPPIRPW